MLDRGFNFVPSKIYLAILIAVLISSGILLLLMNIALLIKIAAIIIFIIYSYHLIHNVGLLRGKRTIQSIRFHEDGRWRVTDNQGIHSAELLGDSVVTAWVCVLRFRVIGKRWPLACVVFRDSLPRGEYRRMVIQL